MTKIKAAGLNNACLMAHRLTQVLLQLSTRTAILVDFTHQLSCLTLLGPLTLGLFVVEVVVLQELFQETEHFVTTVVHTTIDKFGSLALQCGKRLLLLNEVTYISVGADVVSPLALTCNKQFSKRIKSLMV